MPRTKVGEVCADTVRQVRGAAIAIAFGVSMVYLYRNTGVNAVLTAKSMVYVMAESMADLFSSMSKLSLNDITVQGGRRKDL